MAICANCTSEAVYAYRTPGLDVPYCLEHLPSFLQHPDYASSIHTFTQNDESVVEAPKPSSKKKGADPEPVADVPVVEASKDVEAEVNE